ncbi:DUF1835 domain-containing protein [Aquimarina muelleri]|uniref:DUF1835 domain-containing protein n=1 Tax=Aquimarina muelleri TaxID=279356 RepID=A0A918JX60_9FLAO|nr:DUF1835 domain-containing protein [Aquimarina muelleri]MCX2762909.1 DUF1835 domain-containing protein [Aquimarina muelleri]GGX27201.1 hypothetical protein GCM10007384_30620 [Aquimarina muelleri]
MKKTTLHITNGDSLTQRIQELNFVSGEFMVWREMLCEGPTEIKIEEESSIKKRATFLEKYYRISPSDYQEKFVSQLKKIENLTKYKEIVLWFEYDLFCHINMIAAISLLIRKKIKHKPIYIVCSGRIEHEKKLFGLCDLSDNQLKNHFLNKIKLSYDDLEFAAHIWTLYCESKPEKIIGQIKQNSSFEYMSICLRAHLQRFPNMLTGLNVLEHNILEMVDRYQIKNIKHLMGYALEYQGYYGYGDMQMKRVLARLFQFLAQTKDQLLLSERGKLALEHKKNFYNTQILNWHYGGVKKYDYLYNDETHSLLKL